jgi:hypothetical protein
MRCAPIVAALLFVTWETCGIAGIARSHGVGLTRGRTTFFGIDGTTGSLEGRHGETAQADYREEKDAARSKHTYSTVKFISHCDLSVSGEAGARER